MIIEEIVRMDCLQIVFVQFLGRKILQIEGYDGICLCPDCCRDDMPVVRIGEGDGWDKRFVSRHYAVRDSLVHQFYGALKLFSLKILPVREKVLDPFTVDIVRPFSPKKISHCEFYEKISQWRWI